MNARGSGKKAAAPAGPEENGALAEEEEPGPAAAEITERVMKRIRDAAGARVRRTSLRSVSREVGMSATGLQKFLDGTTPYTPTLQRLQRWYVQYAVDFAAPPTAEDVYAAVALLVQPLSPDPRQEAVDGMLACMRDGFARSGRPAPEWLDELRRWLLRAPTFTSFAR